MDRDGSAFLIRNFQQVPLSLQIGGVFSASVKIEIMKESFLKENCNHLALWQYVQTIDDIRLPLIIEGISNHNYMDHRIDKSAGYCQNSVSWFF